MFSRCDKKLAYNMCFSFEISIASFLFSWGTSLYLMQQNLTKYQFNSLVFLMIFSSMQLADALLWWHGMRKTPHNFEVTTYLVPFVITLQLLIIPVKLKKTKNVRDRIVKARQAGKFIPND